MIPDHRPGCEGSPGAGLESVQAPDEISFRCRICRVVMGDFWYASVEDCCVDCVGIDPEIGT